MRRVFADTFYYLALLNRLDEAHEQATEITAEYSGQMVTTDWIITELADGLSNVASRATLIEFVDNLRSDRAVRIVPANHALLQRGWNLYRSRADKDWSLTDCISFSVMREMKLTDALSGDQHFEQAGFRLLMK